MKGVILAAGKGTRLYPITQHIPKPLLPLANRPTIYYAFDRLVEMGIRDICIVVGEMELEMREFLGDGSRYGVQLSYVRQTEPKGLAHALSFTHEFVGEDSFVLYLGDALYGGGFSEHRKRFEASKCANLNIVKPVPDPSRFGVANVVDGQIVKLVEKPVNPESNLAMAGMYFFGPQIWEVLPGLAPSARGEFEITDAIQILIDRGDQVLAGVYDAPWFDTGTLDSFLDASRYVTGGEPLIDSTAKVEGEVGAHVVVGPHAKVRCRSLQDCVIMPNSSIEVEGEIRHSILAGTIHELGSVENQILQGATTAASNVVASP